MSLSTSASTSNNSNNKYNNIKQISSIKKLSSPVVEDLLKKAFNEINNNNYIKSEEILNLIDAFIPKNFNQIIKLELYKFIIGFKNQEITNLISISRKLYKYLINGEENGLENENRILIIKSLFRFTRILHKEEEYYYENFLCQKLLKFKKYFLNENMLIEIANKQTLIYKELNIKILEKKEEFIKMKYKNEYIHLYNIFIENKYDLDLDNKPINQSCYLISTYWLLTFFYYLKYIITEISEEEQNNLEKIDIEKSDKIFQYHKIMSIYFNKDMFHNNQDDFFKYCPAYPGPINNYLIMSNCEHWFDPLPKESYTNQYLSNKVIENNDYQYLDEKTYHILKNIFGNNYEIERKIVKSNNEEGKNDIEIFLLKFKLLVLSKEFIKHNITNLLRVKTIQIKKNHTIEELKNKIIRCINYESRILIDKIIFDNVNWKFHFILPEINQDNLKNDIYNILNCYLNNYSTYIEKIKGIEIDQNSKKTLNNLKISKKDILIVEIEHNKNKNSNWFINLKTTDDYIKCSLCQKPIYENKYKCDNCNNYQYCSKECKNNDKKHITHHQTLDILYKKKFALHDMLSVDIKTLITPNSNHGLTGLKNLGNTCFMNSALQCLSSCEELTKYFLLKKYKEELNKNNTNGSGGQIAKAYYNLINDLWNGTDLYINPWNFKQIFGSFVKQFAGFSQQDSDEMLTFMLDSLHEDLNRVKSKPYNELKEKDENETEEEASLRWWKNHVERENSIIVDLFHGQFKNVVKCPQCKRVNIIYDPFMHLGLPIPTPQSKIRVKFILDNDLYIFFYNCNENTTVRDIKNKLLDECEKIENKNNIDNNFKDKYNINIYGIIVDQNKAYIKSLNDENDEIMNYYTNNYEAVFYKYLTKKDKQIEYFKMIVMPILFNKDDKKSEYKINYIFYPNVFLFETSLSVREIYFHFFIYYRKLFKDIPGNSYENFLENKKNNNINYLNEEFTEYIEVKDSNPFRLFIYNNVPKKAQFSCEYCNRSCKFCAFPFKYSQSVKNIKDSQKIKRPFILYLENLLYSNNPFTDNDININDFKKDLITKSKEISIYDCLEAFRTEEKLEKENSWFCSTCKTHQEAYKRLEIFRVPNILIIQLKRFKIKSTNIYNGIMHNKKNDSFVFFPVNNLDLRQYVVEENSKKDCIYDLCAISQHFGTLSSGHYTAYIKNLGEWYNFDDERVTKLDSNNLEKVVTKAAYILIYRKKSLNKT